MKSIQNQYIALKEGRISQANFMRNVRMALPQYISNVNSFEDTVKILKNKRILTEALDPQDIVKKYNEMFGKDPQTTFEKVAKELGISKNEVERAMVSVTPKGPGSLKLESSEDQSGIDMANDFNDELQNQLEDAEMDPSLTGLMDYVDNLAEVNPEEYNRITDTEDVEKAVQDLIAKYKKFKLGSSQNNDLSDEEFDAMLKQAEEEESGKFTKFQDFPNGISEAKKKKAKEEKPYNPNAIHPSELRMGIKVEMEHTGDPKKAEKIALDHLAENPYYYTALKLAGVDSPSSPKAKAPVAAKKIKKKDATEMTDAANQMQKVKLMKETLEKLIREELRKF